MSTYSLILRRSRPTAALCRSVLFNNSAPYRPPTLFSSLFSTWKPIAQKSLRPLPLNASGGLLSGSTPLRRSVIASLSSSVQGKDVQVTQKDVEIACANDIEEFEDDELVIAAEDEEDEIWNASPALPVRSMTFGPYANDSVVIKKLVHLGVQVYQWEKKRYIPEYILKADFDKDIAPRIRFLCDLGVDPDIIGHVLTKNPYILKEEMERLEARVLYLRSKKFTDEMIKTIVEKNPYWLTFTTQDIDKRLGFFQGYFDLTGPEVRELAVRGPRAVTSHLGRVKDVAFVVKERMGFEPEEIKTLLLQRPELFFQYHPEVLWRKFDYLHNEKKFSHERLVKWPSLLTMKEYDLKARIGFLEKVGRAQFDPTKPGFVSLRDIVEPEDAKFATQVAHRSTLEYNEYLKTL